MNKSIIGTFNVPTPDDLVKARIEQEKKEVAKENARKAAAAREKAAAAREKAEHKDYIFRYIVFIGLCLLDVVFLIIGFICICNWFNLDFSDDTDVIAGFLLGIFYFCIASPCAVGIGCGLFKMLDLKK